MIVMEFISNGNINSILHGNNTNGRVPFPLEERIEIAINVAEALWCMHSMYSPVLHGDIKPDNILLDEKSYTKDIRFWNCKTPLC
jgi:pto-interacting protein 1